MLVDVVKGGWGLGCATRVLPWMTYGLGVEG